MKCTAISQLFIFFALVLSRSHMLWGVDESKTATCDLLYLTAKEAEADPDPDIRLYAKLDPGHPIVCIILNHFPVDRTIHFSLTRFYPENNQFEKHFKFMVNPNGSIKLTGNDVSCLGIGSRGFMPGELVNGIFTNDAGDFQKKIAIVPNRINVKSTSDAAQIEAYLYLTQPETTYKIYLSDFKEKEKVNFASISAHERLENQLTVDKDLKFDYIPGVVGKNGGVSKVTFTRASGEQLQLEFPWGLALLPYAQGDRIYKE